ncbi:hypothetical protein [Cupriavidus cauae]|uniref:Uncharacterized protein n=1 Tax=Cupriavidus cauae TaxID=2608999 RepID=A0A5M8BCZ3_9BURK|nr:hypothetical protein [Cupriavidus cauae]KAA6133299.1 hypothetical protein F1599_01405 [Cupriavidus cauae]
MTWEQAGLWTGVLVSGLYHGLSPAMGWPLAVSNGLMARRDDAVFAALGYLGLGHAGAVMALTLPFGLLASLAAWQREIRFVAAALVIGYGIALLARRRHARALARIPPSRLALWSFAIALAHGAGLMLVPLYLGLCGTAADTGHQAAASLAFGNAGMAVLVALVHTAAMIAGGGAMAWVAYRHVGLALVSRSWLNTDAAWALSLVLVGGMSLMAATAR